MICRSGCGAVILLEQFSSHLCPSPSTPASRTVVTVNDVLQRTVETPTTVEKQAAGNVVRRMIASSCPEANDFAVSLPAGRGKVNLY